MSNVVKFEPEIVGEGFRFDADEILSGALGQPFTTVMVLGQMEDGSIWVSGSANAGETLILMEKAKRQIIYGDG